MCAALLLVAARTFGPQQLPEVDDKDDPLADVSVVIPDLVVRLAYATPDNAAGRVLYPTGTRCLLRKSAAERLALAANTLRKQGFRLVAYDCWRDHAAQEALWKAHPHPGSVADPRRGSLHERGVAVDLGLANLDGSLVEMPTPFDAFGSDAAADAPLADGPAKAHREALRAAMYSAGFRVNPSEWWHFSRVWGWRWPVARTTER
ncbi:MAG TPA: M15 family metallopeptidase [Myxococcales bacterium]|jgi:D-alanyl-D-alanine dipeptidase|nr:M15 family metallopeptidase [Myxococcales bacterium]